MGLLRNPRIVCKHGEERPRRVIRIGAGAMAISGEMLQQKFKEYLASPDREKEQIAWKKQQKSFHQFWKSKILRNTKSSALSETADYDPIIKLIDIKARGFNRHTDIAVAHVGLY
jgi:hypothetical protein